MERLPCSTIIFRAIRARWIDEADQILPVAFTRRLPPNDDDGLSVDVESAQSCARALKKCRVASLHVGRVRDTGLDVTVDDPPHANFVGLPGPDDSALDANRLAYELARQARLRRPEQYLAAEM